MDDIIAKEGDIVLYTGDVSFADSCTVGLMNMYLNENDLYTISMVHRFIGIHYKFVEYSTRFYWYPYKSFKLINSRKYTKEKYKLR